MKILWFSWKDITHPQAGGAEVVADQLGSRLAQDGHEVKFIVSRYPSALPAETVHGYEVVRVGNRVTVYLQAWRYYRRHLRGWADLVIDEVNTIPFFAKYYVAERNILFFHMLCREIWFYQLPKWIGWIGYVLEPVYLKLLAGRQVITVSESTRSDLVRHGFSRQDISIISEGIELEPVAEPELEQQAKYDKPVLLSLGSVRKMKRTLDQVKAFELAKRKIPDLQLKVAGDKSGSYGTEVLEYIHESPYASDIEVLGRVSKQKKKELMQKSHLLVVTSVKEGWGLVVTEAASQGTPAAVYNVDGLRDSVRPGETGHIAYRNTPRALAAIIEHALDDDRAYHSIRRAAWKWGKTITFDRSYNEFKERVSIG